MVSPPIGGCVCAEESPNGMTLRCMCERFNLKVANSFFPVEPTWRSSRGTRARLDNVVLFGWPLTLVNVEKRVGFCCLVVVEKHEFLL